MKNRIIGAALAIAGLVVVVPAVAYLSGASILAALSGLGLGLLVLAGVVAFGAGLALLTEG